MQSHYYAYSSLILDFFYNFLQIIVYVRFYYAKSLKFNLIHFIFSAKILAESEKLTCLYDRPSQGPKWDHNNTMGVPGHFITAGFFTFRILLID